uniref:Uncharacterized protein n=1 Tax=Cacopsylla melanoneura TaxID=428564 RepID=A0A8D9F2M0_9HEMI
MISRWLLLLGLIAVPAHVMSFPIHIQSEEYALDRHASIRDTNIPPAAGESAPTDFDDSETTSTHNANVGPIGDKVSTTPLAFAFVPIKDATVPDHETSYSHAHINQYSKPKDILHNHEMNEEDVVHEHDPSKDDDIVHKYDTNTDIVHDHDPDEADDIVHSHEMNEQDVVHDHDEGDHTIPDPNYDNARDHGEFQSHNPLLGPFENLRYHHAGPLACFGFLTFVAWIFRYLIRLA